MSKHPMRHLKVAPRYVSLHPRQKITASLRLTGDWLLHAGFRLGDLASIEVHDGLLTIRRLG